MVSECQVHATWRLLRLSVAINDKMVKIEIFGLCQLLSLGDACDKVSKSMNWPQYKRWLTASRHHEL